ncbi:hypothetical protein GR255_26365 [Mycobacterium tuberculosis]|nr:hypothetical protein [Mycobacterium tuberculosis]
MAVASLLRDVAGRHRYRGLATPMDAAARIKPERGAVRDEGRKAQVIANACAEARAAGIPESVIADLWERLVEASIAYELVAFDRR